MTSPRIAVVGGGITGLSAGLAINRELEGAEVFLFEASDRLGGKLKTLQLDGIQMEAGADSFIVRDEGFLELCRRLSIDRELTEPAIFGGMLWTGKGLAPLPSGTSMGVPLSISTALRSARALTLRGRLRALADLVLPGPLEGPDVSVGSFIRRRFGREVLERLVDPLLAGTRAGDPDEMSLAAALPPVDALARSSRSLMLGSRAAGSPPRFLTHRAGLSAITDAMAAALKGEILMATPVDRIERAGNGFLIVTAEEGRTCDAVIVCAPAGTAAELLRTTSPEAARLLTTITHASVASIALVFSREGISAAPGSGVLMPSRSSSILSAATWWSVKWPHTAPPDRFVVRAFVGRSGHERALDRADDELVDRVLSDLRTMIRLPSEPLLTDVTRWSEGLPQYEVGHVEKVAAIEAALPESVAVAGPHLRGSGIPDCHHQGVEAARRVSRALLHT